MNEYLKDNLILGDWLENFFGWITLLKGIVGTFTLHHNLLKKTILLHKRAKGTDIESFGDN